MKLYLNRVKWSGHPAPRRSPSLLLLAGLTAAFVLPAPPLHGQQDRRIKDIEAGSDLGPLFYRSESLPGAQVQALRRPADIRQALSQKIAFSPARVELFALRALAAEQVLDFAAAETDWKKYTQLRPNHAPAQLALADFYHRRNRPREEVITLAVAHSLLPKEPTTPTTERQSWQIFERIFALIEAHALSNTLAESMHRTRLRRYPKEPAAHRGFFDFLLSKKRIKEAATFLASYRKTFPEDKNFPLQAAARIEQRQGSPERAFAVYDRAFEPLWPAELVRSYFALLRQTRNLRPYLDRARAAVAADPFDLNATARIFYYHQQQGNIAAAQNALMEFRRRKESQGAAWTAEELFTLAKLFDRVRNLNEAARFYYALSNLPAGATQDQDRLKGLAGLTRILLNGPEQLIRFGSGNLSFYRDIAGIDPYPGFLNGILSLLFNSSEPAREYATQNRSSLAYFHRARAAELIELIDKRFPQAPARTELHAKLLAVYGIYGDNASVIRRGKHFLATFPNAPQRTSVGLTTAEALAREDKTAEEFAIYDLLLEELAVKTGRMPIGMPKTTGFSGGQTSYSVRRRGRPSLARSPEYARVLDRYIARLVSKRQALRALALYRREIDRNPRDPGLYARLAAFVEQNNMGAEIEKVYRLAMERFGDRSWHHKLARWYLRRKRTAEFTELTRQVTETFSGTELEEYFGEVVARGSLSAQLYIQVNLYAHNRFPHNLAFVRNLLSAYRNRATRNLGAWEQLLRRYWIYDETLRPRFFQFLSRRRRLQSELDAVRGSHPPAQSGNWPLLIQNNTVAARFIAEAELWRCHFEDGAPVLLALAQAFPTEQSLARRAAAVHRSLTPSGTKYAAAAVAIEENLHRFRPRDHGPLTRIGEIHAEQEQFAPARPVWNRIAQIESGKAIGYLEAAIIYWDYFQFDDALRLLAEGRSKLADPALFAYQAGAIYENKRDFRRAVREYAQGALADKPDTAARRRLLRLARRPALRKVVEEITGPTVSAATPDAKAVSLRIAVLESQKRNVEIEKLLTRLARSTSSWELLGQIDRIANAQEMSAVRELSLKRQITLTSNPVQNLRLRLSLAGFYENQKNMEAARQMFEGIYSEHPTVLGVVRSVVDFHWRAEHERKERAIGILIEAADRSYPALKSRFRMEAAQKLTVAEQYGRARQLLASLLEDSPFRNDYLAAMADTFAREGDDAGLKNFYLTTIQGLRTTTPPGESRRVRVAGMRRALIPALIRLEEHSAALDQYIEVINRFPEDETLIREAARHAARNDLQERFIAYYEKTTKESPRNYRWPMVLGRLQTHFEDFPQAVTAYGLAIKIRPDRTDFHTARAALQERLLRLNDAARSYEELYELTYQAPQWMDKIAEIRARQGNFRAAVEALVKARVEGRSEQPENFYSVARTLESWNRLAEAKTFTERGLQLAATKKNRWDYAAGVRLYARVLTRLRDYESAYSALQTAQINRSARLQPGSFQSTLREMGQTVNRYFTPQEKAAFASFLERLKPQARTREMENAFLSLAQQAGLAEFEARWRFELMMARPGQSGASAHERRLQTLRTRQMKFNELGREWEEYWRVYPNRTDKERLLSAAAASYRAAGNTDQEFRVRSQLGRLNDRYFELLLKRDPNRIVTLAGSHRSSSGRDAAANFAIRSGDGSLALRAVEARGSSQAPVWSRAFTALTGLHYASTSSAVNRAFLEALGTGTIGERLGTRVERKQQLAGDIWFYYGSRYGEYLDTTRQGESGDYLPAELERTPARVSAYFRLAEYYRERKSYVKARQDYQHVLEFNPNRGDVHDRMALTFWEENKKEEATAQWKAAFAAYERNLKAGRIQDSFQTDVGTTLENIGRHNLLPALRQDADRLIRNYVRWNGAYRVEPLLRGAMAAATDPAAGLAWILDLSRAAKEPLSFLEQVLNEQASGEPWIPKANHEALYRRLIELAQANVTAAQGRAPTRALAQAKQSLFRRQSDWIAYLLEMNETERARAALNGLDKNDRRMNLSRIRVLEIRIAARTGGVAALIERFKKDSKTYVSDDILRNTAADLKKEGAAASARQLLEFLYMRSLDAHDLSAANFLGLAEIRLEEGNLENALSLLRRMTMVSGKAFEIFEPAARLLEKTDHPAAALEFRTASANSTPWEPKFQLKRAQTLLAAKRDRKQALALLSALASSGSALYETRVAAARSFPARSVKNARGGQMKSQSGSVELDLLARGGSVDVTASEQPFFYHARLRAAETERDPQTRIRLLLGAIEIDPNNSEPRLPLFRAAMETNQYALAASALEPVLKERPSYYRRGDQYLPPLELDSAQRASLHCDLARAFEELGRTKEAEAALRASLRHETDSGRQDELKGKILALEKQRERNEENNSRRPVVTRELTQRNTVRPRLTPTGN